MPLLFRALHKPYGHATPYDVALLRSVFPQGATQNIIALHHLASLYLALHHSATLCITPPRPCLAAASWRIAPFSRGASCILDRTASDRSVSLFLPSRSPLFGPPFRISLSVSPCGLSFSVSSPLSPHARLFRLIPPSVIDFF